jgi:ADP-L-glycero-D-manno-heptose 6-epimerase
MKVMVTGSRGFIGQNLIAYLKLHTDWHVDGWNITDNPDLLFNDYDWIIHLGANSSTVERDVDSIMRTNYDFSRWLYQRCCEEGINLQYASSASVYGVVSDFKETSPPDPRNPYAWSKYLFDRHVEQNPTDRIVVQGFRYFNVYGHYEEHKGGQASPVTQFRRQAESTGVIKLFHDSDKYLRDFICVEDVAWTHLQFAQRVPKSGVWNVGTGNAVSFKYVADQIVMVTHADIEYIDMPEVLKGNYQAYTRADIAKLYEAIGPQNWMTVREWIKVNPDVRRFI